MQVIRAQAMGMCFGVKDAIAITRQVPNPRDVTIHGELVHNEQVNAQLEHRGFRRQPEAHRTIPETPAVMITAHGVSNRERDRLAAAGKTIIDTTCPLVRRAHDTALRLHAEGWHVVIAGKRGHVEVIGLAGDLDTCTIIQSHDEALPLPHPRIAIICQTTLQPAAAVAITDAIRAQNPGSEVRLFNTICRPTRERQEPMTALTEQCEAVVVVGGPHSNNTNQLVRLAESAGLSARRVNSPEEVDAQWASQFETIGLTAGTSTPDNLIDAVYERLIQINHGANLK